MAYFDFKEAKRSLGIDDNVSIHCCDFCHKIWKCDCNMCDGEKHMSCTECWAIYCSTGQLIEDVNMPPRLVHNAYS